VEEVVEVEEEEVNKLLLLYFWVKINRHTAL
jgi:hypothetical protein